jgi:hypothetical protein
MGTTKQLLIDINIKSVYSNMSENDKSLFMLYLVWAYNMGQYMRFWRGPPSEYPTTIECNVEYFNTVSQEQNIVYHRLMNKMTMQCVKLIKSITFVDLNEEVRFLDFYVLYNMLVVDCNIHINGQMISDVAEAYIKLMLPPSTNIKDILNTRTKELSLL